MEYKTLDSFIDTVEGRSYKKGVKFEVGDKTDKKRLNNLLSNNNGQGKPMIEVVQEEKKVEKKGK